MFPRYIGIIVFQTVWRHSLKHSVLMSQLRIRLLVDCAVRCRVAIVCQQAPTKAKICQGTPRLCTPSDFLTSQG